MDEEGDGGEQDGDDVADDDLAVQIPQAGQRQVQVEGGEEEDGADHAANDVGQPELGHESLHLRSLARDRRASVCDLESHVGWDCYVITLGCVITSSVTM